MEVLLPVKAFFPNTAKKNYQAMYTKFDSVSNKIKLTMHIPMEFLTCNGRRRSVADSGNGKTMSK